MGTRRATVNCVLLPALVIVGCIPHATPETVTVTTTPSTRTAADVEPGSEPTPTIRVSTTGAQTESADERWGGPADGVRPLPPIPLLVSRPAEVGSRTHPAQYLTFERPITGVRLAAAYHDMYERYDGLSGWLPLAETPDGWHDFVSPTGVEQTRRVACATDLLLSATIDDVMSVENLTTGCAFLQRALGGTLGPALDAATVQRDFEALVTAVRERGRLELRFRGPNGFDRRSVHRVARALGFVRSDFGTYAVYNEQRIGHDRLILLDIGVHADAPDARTNDMVLTVNLPLVPAPIHVAARMWWAAEAFAEELGVAPIWYEVGVYEGEPVTEAAFRAELRERMNALTAAGYRPTAVVADEPD